MQTSNLDSLTEKIYQEGIEKAEHEASEIVSNANTEAEKIISEAKAKADEILRKAQKDADQLAQKSEGEIKLKSNQLISDLKRQIRELIKDHIIREKISELALDTDFLQDIIREMIADWKKEESAELIFSENLKSRMDDRFNKAIAGSLGKLTISFDEKLSTGFRIQRKSDNFQVTFTDEDFNELFSSYLDERTSKLLF